MAFPGLVDEVLVSRSNVSSILFEPQSSFPAQKYLTPKWFEASSGRVVSSILTTVSSLSDCLCCQRYLPLVLRSNPDEELPLYQSQVTADGLHAHSLACMHSLLIELWK